VRSYLLRPGDRALVVDDWAATGAQSRALSTLITALNAIPVGTAVIVDETRGEPNIRGLLSGADLDGANA
jgi:adenine phosphoribosyltransferase